MQIRDETEVRVKVIGKGHTYLREGQVYSLAQTRDENEDTVRCGLRPAKFIILPRKFWRPKEVNISR